MVKKMSDGDWDDYEANAYPVKYMVVKALLGWRVISTTLEDDGRTVCGCKKLEDAHNICGLLNRSEGYTYYE